MDGPLDEAARPAKRFCKAAAEVGGGLLLAAFSGVDLAEDFLSSASAMWMAASAASLAAAWMASLDGLTDLACRSSGDFRTDK